MPIKHGWHRADIVAAIHKKGTSLRRLALERGLAESTLRAALQKPRRPSNRIIAAVIGKPIHELWPQWFDASGNLIASRRKGARRAPGLSSQKRRAA